MKLLHAQSQQCLCTELDLFSVPPTQTSIDSSQWVEHSPVSTISASAPIEFVVAGSGEDYLDLSNKLLEVRAKLTADGSTVTAEVAVAPVNNVFHSMFSQLDVSLNDVSVSSASTTYPYRAYMETHLNYGHDAKVSKLQAGLYYMDTNLTVLDPRPTGDNAVTNTGLAKRHQLCTKTGTFDMIGPLHVDVFNQSRYLLNGVTMKLRLSRSKDAFVLMAKTAGEYKMEVMSAKLFVRKVKITPSLVLANEKMLGRSPAKYPITRVECKVIHLPQGQRSFTHENLFLGHLPKRIVFGIVDNRSYNGDMTMNPFNFRHCNLKFLAVHLDGQQIPWAPLQPSFSQDNYIRAFNTPFTGGVGISTDNGHLIGREYFSRGHALYCFDLTPDLSSSCSHHLNVAKTGNLQLELGFERSLPFTGNVIVYSEFDNIIEIDKDRVVTRNYGY